MPSEACYPIAINNKAAFRHNWWHMLILISLVDRLIDFAELHIEMECLPKPPGVSLLRKDPWLRWDKGTLTSSAEGRVSCRQYVLGWPLFCSPTALYWVDVSVQNQCISDAMEIKNSEESSEERDWEFKDGLVVALYVLTWHHLPSPRWVLKSFRIRVNFVKL